MIKKCTLLLFFVFWGILSLRAQINSTAATIPFGTNTSYPGVATLPTNLPTGGAYGKSQDAANAYNYWKTTYVVSCGGGQSRVLFDDGTSTVSEGIGYGMLLTAYAGDKTTFDALYAFYKANADANGLMNWKIGGCTGASGTMGATDADEDAAMALLVAAYQWPTATAPYTYKTEANKLITAINKCEIDTKTSPPNQPSNGDGWINCNSTSNTCRNPSYMAPAYYKCFAASPDVTSAQSVPWLTVEAAAQTLVLANVNANSGLVTNWSDQNGVENGCNGPANQYGYDACRNPWRMAVDVAWYGDAWAQTICSNIAKECQAAGAANVTGVVGPAGPITGGTHDATFVSTFMAGCIGSTTTYQATINSMYTETVNTTDTPPLYFGNTLRTLALFLATGNFWNPCNAVTTPPCSSPSLGADQSLCGTGGSITLNSHLSTATNRTFHWYNASAPTTQLNSVASQPTQTTWTVTAAGKYFVTVDSALASGTCSETDTIVISATLPVPNIGTKDTLCTTTFYNLTPSNLASFPAGTTWQWQSGSSNITGATTSTLSDIRTAGTYTLIASISGCASTSGNVTIISDLPTPIDGCAPNAGQTANLSITPQSGHTSDTYDWYSAASSGSSLGTGTNFTTPAISTTTTYYVQDMSAVAGTVGPTTLMGATQNWGINTGLHENFNALQAFTINSVQVPLLVYTAGVTTITVGVNGTTTTYTSQSATPTCTPTCTTLVTFTFSPGIPIAAGNSQYLVLTALTTSGSANPLWNNNTATYPYNSNPSGIVSITGGSGGSGTTDYMFFYNWNISTGTACNRIPVVATVGGCTVTPVTLAGFNLANDGSSVMLYWATASELNNDYFNVERSRDGYNFEPIGQVKGNGTSNVTHTYSFTDANPIVGTGYYRLAQYDYDGTVEYSQTLSTTNEDKTVVTVAPNPFTHQTSILISGARNETAYIKVLDLTGKILYTGNSSTNEGIILGSDFSNGLYILQVQINDRVYVQKMIKQ